MNSSVSADTAHLAADLRLAIAAVRRKMRSQSREPGELTESQRAVLRRLAHEGPATVAGLARAEGVRPQSTSATVAALEAAGVVSRHPDATDGRKILVELTDDGRERIEASRRAREDWLRAALDDEFTAAERETLREAVGLLERLGRR